MAATSPILITAPPPPLAAPSVTTDYKRFASASNLGLAWERLLRSSDPAYKAYWRSSAMVANPIRKELLRRIRQELIDLTFNPDHACVISIPKPNGLLRHISILSLGDQVVYQALLNVIADRTFPAFRKLYRKNVFGNLYAGPKSKFFFQRWQDTYKEFNKAQRQAHSAGRTWVARFDFASYYDSIDHGCLLDLLSRGYSIGPDVLYALGGLLKRWSSASGEDPRGGRVYLGHGIPQGPQPSGLLAEFPLHYLDSEMVKLRKITYLRYADDVRIFGATERDVRFAATVLDRLARNVGIFPQTKKFSLGNVNRIDEILKNPYLPDETSLDEDDLKDLSEELRGNLPITVLWSMLRSLVEGEDLENLTLFKALLGTTSPTTAIAESLCNLVVRRPDLCDVACRYIERLPALNPTIRSKLITAVMEYEAYPWFCARIAQTLRRFWNSIGRSELKILRQWSVKASGYGGVRTDATLSSVSRLMSLEAGKSSAKDLETWCKSSKTPWWSVVTFILEADEDLYGTSSFKGLLESMLIHPNREVQRAAAYRLCLNGCAIPSLPLDIEPRALFRVFGLASKTQQSASRIGMIFNDLLLQTGLFHGTLQGDKINWHALLPQSHTLMEKYVVRLLSSYGPSKNGFICDLDAALELLVKDLLSLTAFHWTDSKGATKKCQTRKQVIRDSFDFRSSFPKLRAFCVAANDLRNRCDQPHAMFTASGKPRANRPVYFSDVLRVFGHAKGALEDLANAFPA